MTIPHTPTATSAHRRIPHLRWVGVLGLGFMTFMGAVAALETALALRGYTPSLADSYPLWEQQRRRVDKLGSRALVLVGNSRMQIDLDLDTLRRETDLEPVQLAVGGASFLPVMKGLAEDSAVTGTVLVNLEPQELAVNTDADAAYKFESQYRHAPHTRVTDFADVEAALVGELRVRLRSYADGTDPLDALLLRVLVDDPHIQYVKTFPDREQVADFSKVKLPELYYVRALHDLPAAPALKSGETLEEERRAIEATIAALEPEDNHAFLKELPALAAMVAAIQARGGRVLFIRLPRTGYLRQIDDRRFPRALFWDRFRDAVHAPALDFETVPVLQAFDCPDGSHLDVGARAPFTMALVGALGLHKQR